MEKEARSDFARYVSVYQNGAYAGRFVMGAENDCLVLSQIVCVDGTRREEFLYGALSYCEQEYHYGRYQLVLDETWREVLRQPGSYDGVRILPVKEKPIIMFRILDLEKLGASLESDSAGDDACRIFVKDAFFDEQEGSYLLQVKGRSDLFLRLEVIKKIVGVVILCATLPFGLVVMCVGQIVSSIFSLVINTHYTGKLIQVGFLRQMKDLFPMLITSLLMWGVVIGVQLFFDTAMWKLLAGILSGILFYLGASWLFRFPELKEVRNILWGR